MESAIENIGALQRRFDIKVSLDKLQNEIEGRLQRLAKTTKLHGFRPGKIPLKMIRQMYAAQVQQDVISDAVHKEFLNTVKSLNLKVVGYPNYEAKSTSDEEKVYVFSATFEVYPEVIIGDLGQQNIERPTVQIGEDEVDKTLDMIRKQRVTYEPVSRQVQKGDRVTIDYHGTIEGNAFPGGEAANVQLIIGEGKFLKIFETELVGMKIADNKSFDVGFPEDYHGKDVAGKTAVFNVKLNAIEAPILPDLDADFVRTMGVPDGDLQKLREGIRNDLEREVSKRVRSRLKEQVMQVLLNITQIDAPMALVNQEKDRLLQNAKSNLEARGIKSTDIPFTSEYFQEKAEHRIKLGLILSELMEKHSLKATPEQVRGVIEEAAQSYENPEQVIKWHYASAERLQDAESLALEENIVNWALDKVKLTDKPTAFDELMGVS